MHTLLQVSPLPQFRIRNAWLLFHVPQVFRTYMFFSFLHFSLILRFIADGHGNTRGRSTPSLAQ